VTGAEAEQSHGLPFGGKVEAEHGVTRWRRPEKTKEIRSVDILWFGR
jgi:hypothetical protein